jgi:hypothetical protein
MMQSDGHDLLEAELLVDERNETAAVVAMDYASFVGCGIGARIMLSDNHWHQQLGSLLSPSRRFGGQE